MDFSPVLSNAVTMLLWFVPLLVVIGIAKSPWFKGVLGEFMVNTAIKLMLDKKHYHLLDNVTLPTKDGSTQIDHIIVSRFGIFVMETKNMKGWIFGSEHQKQWTQKIFKHTARFQNPLHQNYKHTKTLSSCLEMDDSKLFPVVVFVGDSTFKTPMPENVTYAGGLIRYIKSKTSPLLSDSEVSEAIERIKSGRLAPTFKNHRAHIRHVQEIKQKKAAEKPCPKCGNVMVLRTARKGTRAGTRFWGCTQYPRCRAAILHKEAVT
ncbi:nuclease-related domain-containing protein [Endozoicomonas elysicola]|uniref:Nuclease n=1 Tax=Endozoicomonas elysicola TaxID=305900 RepID=A0A081KD06_9GAMM|nr:NERD domain-containing protein [Endozoicomonas elysicola]KEI72032.1 nuclease [Endozoicomonas elysicola]